jgi:N-acetyl-anhydromuramyl-L-alanine amidase AmpD
MELKNLNIKFVQARNYTKANRTEIRYIVLHSMEAAESSTTAEAVSNWFSGSAAPKASAHFCIDNNSIVQCVNESSIAWHAPGANQYGLGLEHAGFAKQTREQWLDQYSIDMLKLSAKLTAALCKKWNIPVKYVDANGLKNGETGITTHYEVNQAFKKSTHTDPGKGFPTDLYIQWVQENLDNGE